MLARRSKAPCNGPGVAGHHISAMCGRVIQSSAPIRLAIVEGLDARDSRFHNYPPRWNGAPSQELPVVRRNHHTGELSLDPLRWGLIPYWCYDPKGGRRPINAKCETVRTLPTFHDAYRRRRCILPVDGFFEWRAIRGQKAKQPYAIAMKDGSPFGRVGAYLRDHHDGRQRACRRNPRPHAADRRARRLRALARRGARSARPDAAVPVGPRTFLAAYRRSICPNLFGLNCLIGMS